MGCKGSKAATAKAAEAPTTGEAATKAPTLLTEPESTVKSAPATTLEAIAQPTAAVEEQKADAPKTEEPKADAPKAEEPNAVEPKPDESMAAKGEEPKAEEPKAEEPKAEEPKAEEPKAEELKTDDLKIEEPKDLTGEAKLDTVAKAEEANAEQSQDQGLVAENPTEQPLAEVAVQPAAEAGSGQQMAREVELKSEAVKSPPVVNLSPFAGCLCATSPTETEIVVQ